MDFEFFLHKVLYAVFVIMCIFVAYSIGKQSTIDKVFVELDQSEQMYKDSVVIDDLRLDISKLR